MTMMMMMMMTMMMMMMMTMMTMMMMMIRISCLVLGRASVSPSMDLFITLLSLGQSGYHKLIADRKAMFQYLHQQLSFCAERHGQRLLKTKNNPISVGMCSRISVCLHFQ